MTDTELSLPSIKYIDLRILQHALGLDRFGRGKSYREHFVTGPGSSDFAACQSLVARGLMITRPATFIGDSTCFLVTAEGRNFVEENSPKPPKLTKAQKRYQTWLNGPSDVMSFGDWLKHPGSEACR